MAGELRTLDEATAREHYRDHEGRPYFERLVAFITRGPVFVAVVAGPAETWRYVRAMMGATNPLDAAPGTIRADWALEMGENLIHGSDSPEAAARETALFFPHLG